MTKFIKRTFLILPVLAALSTPASAQTLSAIVPFDFQIGDSKMLAGAYRIYNFAAPVGMEVCREGGHCVAVPSKRVRSTRQMATARLTFENYDGVLELKRISTPNRPSYELRAPSDTIDRRAAAEIFVVAKAQ